MLSDIEKLDHYIGDCGPDCRICEWGRETLEGDRGDDV